MTAADMFVLEDQRKKRVRILHPACTTEAATACLRAAVLADRDGHGLATAFLKANPAAYLAGSDRGFVRAHWAVVGAELSISKKRVLRYTGPLAEFLSTHGEPIVLFSGTYHDKQSALSTFARLHSKALAYVRRGCSVNPGRLTELVELIEATWPADVVTLAHVHDLMDVLDAERPTWGKSNLGALLQQAGQRL
jgi:hypothetical protein